MCVLKAFSSTQSFKAFAQDSQIPVFSVKEKGDLRIKATGELYGHYRISFDVSKKEWNDFAGQVEDAIVFLKQYGNEIKQLCQSHEMEMIYLDFPLYSRLKRDIVEQTDFLPAELIQLAGEVGVGIALTQYA